MQLQVKVADTLTGLLSEETTAFLTDNFDTIVDLGTAAYQIADGDKIVGLMTGLLQHLMRLTKTLILILVIIKLVYHK